MKKRVAWLTLSCLMMLFLVPASCAPQPITKLTIRNPVLAPVPPRLPPVPMGKQPRPLREYPQVVLGKDNWLFSGDPINELIRYGGLDDAKIERCVSELSYVNESLKEQGVDFLFLLVPDKHLIYPEFMPDTYDQSDVPSSYERLSEALSKTDIDFIDCKPLLLEKKKETGYRLYYMRDVNWNRLGNFYVIQEILAHLSKKHPVPKFELLSVDTSENRVCDAESGNDLNDLIESLFPWQEKGAPEPVYEVYPEPEAPPILWYGSCFSPEVIDMMQGSWPNSITYCSLYGEFGFPLSLRKDLDHRLNGHKIVIFEIAEHYRQSLSGTLVREQPEIDLTSCTQVYNWQSSSFLQNWKPEVECDLEAQKEVVLVNVKDPDLALSFRTAGPLRLEPSRQYYLVIKMSSPAITGIVVEFSTLIRGERFENGRGQHIYEGNNTVVFEVPDQDRQRRVRNIRIILGDKAGVYGISQIAIYARPR